MWNTERIVDDVVKLAANLYDSMTGLEHGFPFTARRLVRKVSLASTAVPLRQRNFRVSAWLPQLLALAFLAVPVAGEAATVWSGPRIVFTKTDSADPKQASSQDRLTPNVWLTRAASQGLYNVARETTFAHSLSPADTEWASGTTAGYGSLKYTDWETWARSVGNPPATPGVSAVLHLKTDDIYLDIKFLSWSERSGGFSYERSTSAVATPSSYLLSITTVGSGTITSNPAVINCGSTCSASFNGGTGVTLTATPASGSTFVGWSGDCTGAGACTVSMSAAKSVTANFSITASDCLFNWAEGAYPQFFKPSKATSATFEQYYYRYYPDTGNYLATGSDNYIYLLGPVTGSGTAIVKLGPMADYLAMAACSQ
jgi:hypothetical protein